MNENFEKLYDSLKTLLESEDTSFTIQGLSSGFFWIGTNDGVIGSSSCHYEIIIQNFDAKEYACLHVHSENDPDPRNYLDESTTKEILDSFDDFEKVPKSKYRYRRKEQDQWPLDGSADPEEIAKGILTSLKEIDSIIHEKLKDKKTIMETQEYLDLLKANYNLVLTGAPGTGKSFLANEIAAQMVGTSKPYSERKSWTSTEQNLFDEHVKFVQFHPSYDYTDFVEGLRPKKTADGFEYKPGVFKEFCRRAVQGQIITIYNFFVSQINSRALTSFPLHGGGSITVLGISPDGNIVLKADGSTSSRKYPISLDKLLELAEHFPSKPSLDQMKNIDKKIREAIKGCNSSAMWAVLHAIYEVRENPVFLSVPNVQCDLSEPKFVFIIDEINRGELSKIFGELFFAIDPGYRGPQGKIETQYQNMIDSSDVFANGFYVPENVYIIGTMNDIDRSVESMDFAMRRRFVWKEVKPEDRVSMWGTAAWATKASDVMKKINEKISNTPSLGPAFQIGPAYFKKLDGYNGDFQKLWEYHISIIIKEYLRGNNKAQQLEKEFEDLYFSI